MLTASQEQFWNALKGPEFYCHQRANELTAIRGRGKRFHQAIDQSLKFIIDNFDQMDGCRILHTWLRVYEFPINPCKLTIYDEFHNQFGKFIMENDNLKNIKAF
jgi:hypothetical protein